MVTGDPLVQGGSNVGGFIGTKSGGTIKAGFWDSSTNISTMAGVGGGGSTSGITHDPTSTLQSLAIGTGGYGFTTSSNCSCWAIVTNQSFPYFTWQFATAPQVVSGIAYGNLGTTPLAGGTVTELVNGNGGLTSSTGFNGAYYFLLPAGTISSAGSQVLAYTSGANAGVAYQQNATGSVTGLNINGAYLTEYTPVAAYSAGSGLSQAIGGNATVQTLVNGLNNLGSIRRLELWHRSGDQHRHARPRYHRHGDPIGRDHGRNRPRSARQRRYLRADQCGQ